MELFGKKFGIELQTTTDLNMNTVKDEAQIERLRQYLDTLNSWELLATEISISAVRSVCLGILAVTGELDLEEALYNSRLEEEYQASHYGKVEGAHDIDEAQLLAHVTCARLLFTNSKAK